MKKLIALIPTTALALSIWGTAVAAPANSFTDVPRDHWAYEALQNLAKQGIVEGYNGNFNGDQTLTRYEIAEILARVMAKTEKADPKTQEDVKKLQAEFRQELRKLGVRVARLEKRIDKAKWTAEIRARYDNDEINQGNAINKTIGQTLRTRLMLEGQVNRDWSYYARLENTQDLRESGQEGALILNRAYVSGPILNKAANLSLGRISYMPAYGIITDNEFDGVQLSFGSDVLKTNLFYGKEEKNISHKTDSTRVLVPYDANKYTGGSSYSRDTLMTGAELIYKGIKNTNVKFAHMSFEGRDMAAGRETPKLKIHEIGFDTKIGDDFTVHVIRTDSNAPDGDQASVASLTYKSYDIQVPNSFNVYGQYRKLGRFSTWYTTSDTIGTKLLAVPTGTMDNYQLGGIKGWEFGGNYVLDKNILLNANYFDGENTDGVYQTNGEPWKDKVYRVSLYWLF